MAESKSGQAVSPNDMANAIRALSMDAVEAAKSGHPGMPMGMADVATVLFTRSMRYDASNPSWPNRDRFVLSAGHGSMLLYSLLYLTGYPGMDIDQLRNFRQLGSKTAGHPEFGHAPGIETTTGPLGQGIANAVGLALAERIWNARVGDVIDHHTYVIAGDGCLMEGISHEAISMAGHLGLGKLIVLFDDNGISIDGPTSLAVSDDQRKRFEASGWNTAAVDGHDPEAVYQAIEAAKADPSKPWMIATKTTIGKGSPNKAGTAGVHGAPLGGDEITNTRTELGWNHDPFVVPEAILAEWRTAGSRQAAVHEGWSKDWQNVDASIRAAYSDPANADIQQSIAKAINEAKEAAASTSDKKATRVWSQLTLEKLQPAIPGLIGGSADLTGSNNTRVGSHSVIKASEYSGNYIHYGVREHGMAAAMNGLALYGGLIPYGGTFLVFTDYCRPSIRLSALMKQRAIYVMTHDSIGLGEDGPTHQPVEHVAALRTIPNLNVFRPADGVETAECWELAVLASETPSVLALTRQGVSNLRTTVDGSNLCANGAYIMKDVDGDREITLVATGSEVSLAVDAANALAEKGVKAAVVSMPSMELFRASEASYRAEILGTAPRIFIEAGVRSCWHEWMQSGDEFVGLSDFGASAPAAKLFEHFNLTAADVVKTALTKLGK